MFEYKVPFSDTVSFSFLFEPDWLEEDFKEDREFDANFASMVRDFLDRIDVMGLIKTKEGIRQLFDSLESTIRSWIGNRYDMATSKIKVEIPMRKQVLPD